MPDYHGTVMNLPPADYQPWLVRFRTDRRPPGALVLAFVPHARALSLATYSARGAAHLRRGLREIHRAGVLHRDTWPRNMLFLARGPVPAMWIDFDRAFMYAEMGFTPRQQEVMCRCEAYMTDEILAHAVGSPPGMEDVTADSPCQAACLTSERAIGYNIYQVYPQMYEPPRFGSDDEDAGPGGETAWLQRTLQGRKALSRKRKGSPH